MVHQKATFENTEVSRAHYSLPVVDGADFGSPDDNWCMERKNQPSKSRAKDYPERRCIDRNLLLLSVAGQLPPV